MYYVDLAVPADPDPQFADDPELAEPDTETVHVTMPQVPRAGELVEVKGWSHTVETVTWRVLPDREPDGTTRPYTSAWRPVVALARIFPLP